MILAPKVYSQGYIKELFYFDMEYVNGIKFNDFIKNNSFIYVKSHFLQLITFILNNFKNENKNFEDIILDKINHIAKTNLIDNQIIETMKINSKKDIPTGYCHGDFTFENILLSNNRIYLIDFLDSFIDSPILDLSKLFQEFDLNWSNRNSKSNFSTIIKNHFLKVFMLECFSNHIKDFSTLNLQRKLTLMRILPYSTDLKLKLKLINLINKN